VRQVVNLYKNYVQKADTALTSVRSDKKEFQQEYNRQREHLEKNVEALKCKIAKDLTIFEADHQQLVRDNVLLTEEINMLRREEKKLSIQQQQLQRAANTLLKPKARLTFYATSELASTGRSGSKSSRRPESGGDPTPPSVPSTANGKRGEAASAGVREVEMQRKQIEQLESHIRRLQDVLDVPPAERISQLA
jgi:hypothetical protein